jgi:hypothetical protein
MLIRRVGQSSSEHNRDRVEYLGLIRLTSCTTERCYLAAEQEERS